MCCLSTIFLPAIAHNINLQGTTKINQKLMLLDHWPRDSRIDRREDSEEARISELPDPQLLLRALTLDSDISHESSVIESIVLFMFQGHL
jgi:hypothetical protein